ncbi:MAG TPA: helix-turn-helix domain-containing protein [Mucilaginibacter sp.]|jgi:hypothetical protein|nr:helix-turn-helix domain-containing protein [Mucilaginibacter sp.]
MTTLDLITKQDLEQFKIELFAELKELGIGLSTDQSSKQWLKSTEVRKLLKISPGTLQNLRIHGTLSYTRVGSILYYKYEDILKVLEGNTINN